MCGSVNVATRLGLRLGMQGVICRENSQKISIRFSLSAVNFHGS